MASSSKRNSIFTSSRNYGAVSGSNALKPSATSPSTSSNASDIRLGSSNRLTQRYTTLREQYQQEAGIKTQVPTPTPINTSRPNPTVREHIKTFGEQAKQEPATTPVDNVVPFPSPTPPPTQSTPTVAAPPEPPPAVSSAPTAPATPLSSTPKIIPNSLPTPPNVNTSTSTSAPNNADTHTITKANEALSQSNSRVEEHNKTAEAQYKQSQKLTQNHDLAALGNEANNAVGAPAPTSSPATTDYVAEQGAWIVKPPLTIDKDSFKRTADRRGDLDLRSYSNAGVVGTLLAFGFTPQDIEDFSVQDIATIANTDLNRGQIIRDQLLEGDYQNFYNQYSATNKHLLVDQNYAHSGASETQIAAMAKTNSLYGNNIYDRVNNELAPKLSPHPEEIGEHSALNAWLSLSPLEQEAYFADNGLPGANNYYATDPLSQFDGISGREQRVMPWQFANEHNKDPAKFRHLNLSRHQSVPVLPIAAGIATVAAGAAIAATTDDTTDQDVPDNPNDTDDFTEADATDFAPPDNFDNTLPDESFVPPQLSRPPDFNYPPDNSPADEIPDETPVDTDRHTSSPYVNNGNFDNEEYGDSLEERTSYQDDYQQARSGEDLDTDDGQAYQEPEQQEESEQPQQQSQEQQQERNEPRQQREQQPEEKPEQQQNDEQQPNQESPEQQQPEQKTGENQPETKEDQPGTRKNRDRQSEPQSGDQSPDKTKPHDRNKPGEKTGQKPDPTKPHQKVDKQFGKGPTSKQNPNLKIKKPNVKGIRGIGQKIGNGLRNVGSKAAQGAKAAARAAAKAAQAAARAIASLASKLAPLMANPYFWIVVAIIAVIVLLIILITGGTGGGSGINSTAKDNDSGAAGGGGNSIFMNENDCLHITKSVTPAKLEGSETPLEFATYTYSISLDPQCANITFDGSCSDIETITCNSDPALTDTQCPDPNATGTPADWVNGKRDLSPFVCSQIAEALTGDPAGDITGKSLGNANTTKCNGTQISWIGDSISVAAEAQINAKFPGVTIDAEVGRKWQAGITIAQNTTLREYVVFALGSNDGSLTNADITNAINAITAAGGKNIVFITNAGLEENTNSLHNNYDNNNTLFNSTGNANVTVVDWAAAIAANPEEYLRRDDDNVTVHPTAPDGTIRFAETVYNTLDCGAASGPPTAADPSGPSSVVFTLEVDVPQGNNFKQDNLITLGYTASIYGNLMTGSTTNPENSGGPGDCTAFHTTARGQQVPFCFQQNATVDSYVPASTFDLYARGCGPTSAVMAIAGTGKWTGTTQELFQTVIGNHPNEPFAFAALKNSAIAAGAQSETKNFETETEFRTYVNDQLSQGRFVIIKLSILNSDLPKNKHVIYTGTGQHYVLLTELLPDGTIFMNNPGSVYKNYAATQDQIFGEAATVVDGGGSGNYQATTIW